MCFCGHVYGEHFRAKKTARNLLKSHCKKEGCKCAVRAPALRCVCELRVCGTISIHFRCGMHQRFEFIPMRPEEVGMWWLVRRPDFNITKWSPKCRCACSPAAPRLRCVPRHGG